MCTVRLSSVLLVSLMIFFSCSSDDDEGQNGQGDVLVDIADFGMTGESFIGSAILSAAEIQFPNTEIELSTIVVSMSTSPLSLEQFTNPPLEYNGEPALLRVTLVGEVQDHEPGSIDVEVTGLFLRMLDQDEQMLGTSDTEELIDGLAQNGVEFPTATTSDRFAMSFGVTAKDEDYTEIYITSDKDFFVHFTGSE